MTAIYLGYYASQADYECALDDPSDMIGDVVDMATPVATGAYTTKERALFETTELFKGETMTIYDEDPSRYTFESPVDEIEGERWKVLVRDEDGDIVGAIVVRKIELTQ